MQTAFYEELGSYYGRREVIQEINNEAIRHARNIFDEYKKRGVILNHSFDDTVWKLSNQRKNVGLTLVTFDGNRRNALEWIGCDHLCYFNCVKVYIALNLGKLGLGTLRNISDSLTELSTKMSDEAIDTSDNINHIVEFLQIIPNGNEKRDYVIEALEEKAARNARKRDEGKQRQLADFKTYLSFNDILDTFWITVNKKQKLFYFPLYFWWHLTSILPLRPMEFLLTPRDCLETGGNGENVLTIRRTKLKGGFQKNSYCVEDDYERKQYTINDGLAMELRSYLKSTERMRKTEIGTLFLQRPHFEYIGRKGNIQNNYYTYGNLTICLKHFYDEVVGASGGGLGDINFGDTRHIAMASLIITGGSPVICRELAGHSDIDISSHYFSNVSNLVECVTRERYRKSQSDYAEIVGTPKFTLTIREEWYRLPNGWCDAPSVKKGDISECLKVSDSHGHIGNCSHCEHYRPDQQGIRAEFFDVKKGKEKVDSDCKYLLRMIELVRKGLGYTEDIGSALIRLQRSSNHYSKCLLEKYMKEGDA